MDKNLAGADSLGNGSSGNSGALVAGAAEPVRTRWTPKPEQILILESIFNSGMVNPPKDETVRIRKLLEKFGSVGDANVFYWFQNRRSRSRRRQRQIQAGLLSSSSDQRVNVLPAAGILSTCRTAGAGGATPPEATSPSTSGTSSSNSSRRSFVSPAAAITATATSCFSPSFLPDDDGAEDLFSISRQMGSRTSGINQQTLMSCSPAALTGHSSIATSSYYHSGGFNIAVFINGILREVPRGPFDVRAVLGQDMMLIHSSGELVPMNDYGILFQGLLSGESYFLVPRSM